MSHTSRRGPPIECPLASLGRNTPSMSTQPYHHPLSTSPLNPQVYQMSRQSPILTISDNAIYRPTSRISNESRKVIGQDNPSPPAYPSNRIENDSRYTPPGTTSADTSIFRPPLIRSYIPMESILSYNECISPDVESSSSNYCLETINNNVMIVNHHSDEYFLEDKLNSLYIRDAIQHHPGNSERYYLEENMDNMSTYTSSNRPDDTASFPRASSPSETSGSDRYFIRARESPAGLSAARPYAPFPILSIKNQSSSSGSTNLVDGLSRIGRFSPSLDQGYATLVSPSPSGQQTPGPWNKKTTCRTGSGFDRLPDEAVLKIFYWLNSCELCRVARVCRRFEILVWKPTLWKTITLKGEFIVGDKALKAIFRRLCGQTRNGACPDVERVMLGDGCRLTDKGLQLLGRRCPELTHLQVQFSSQVTNNTLFETITKCTNLQHLDITGCTQITTLNFNPLNDLSRRFLLQYLDLTDCSSINDAGLRTIVKNCPQLVYLYLRRCIQLTDAGLKFVPSFCTALRELSVSDCCGITDFGLYELAKLGATLRYLSVAKCDQVSDAGLKVIARRCYKLRYLNARGCEAVSDDSITVLAQSCPRLRALDIGKCDVSDAGLRALAESCPNLKKISLRNCDMITDRGVQCIAYYCRGLQQLNIQDCQISLEGYRAVKKYCKRCVIEHTNPGFC